MSRQLPLDLPRRDRWGREDFFPSPANAQARGMLDNWHLWPGGMLLLVGPQGAGKTHLAHIWAAEAGADWLRSTELAGRDLPDLVARPALVIEDLHLAAGLAEAETALFHLFNMARAAHRPVLFTARAAPRDWGMGLADLQSRLQSLALAEIAPPDDALLAAVLAKLFADAQVAVPPRLISYLLPRMERSIDAARHLVAALDRRALARGGPITLADAAGHFAQALDRPEPE